VLGVVFFRSPISLSIFLSRLANPVSISVQISSSVAILRLEVSEVPGVVEVCIGGTGVWGSEIWSFKVSYEI
jgi:hypothetical protein